MLPYHKIGICISGVIFLNNKIDDVLKKYNLLKQAYSKDGVTTQFIKIVDNALDVLSDDEFYEIIPLSYFEHKSREWLAEYFDVTVTTISRQKKRLLNELYILIFADDYVLGEINAL